MPSSITARMPMMIVNCSKGFITNVGHINSKNVTLQSFVYTPDVGANVLSKSLNSGDQIAIKSFLSPGLIAGLAAMA